MKRFVVMIVLTAALAGVARPASAETPSPREDYWSAGVGVGVFIFLPSFRLFARYALDDVSFEVRGGVFAPAFAVGRFVYEVSAGPRFHVLKRETLVGYVAPRIGFWDIGPPGEEDEGALTITDLDRDSRYVNPTAMLAVGADFFLGGWVLSPELGGGVVWGQRFENFDSVVVPLLEVSAQVGWVF